MIKSGEAVEIGKQAYGSNRWYAVRQCDERHPANALWLKTEGDGVIQTSNGPVRTDGLARFFQTKTAVLNAVIRTKETK